MKRKSFGVPQGLGGSIAAQLGPDETPRIEVVPLSELELDPENPRRLGIGLDEVMQNFNADDERWEPRRATVDGLVGLAASIRAEGVVQPIRIYRRGEKYRVAFGERRVLASAIAGKPSLPAVILSERPDRLRLVQLVENSQREDLSLWLRLRNVHDVIVEMKSAGERRGREDVSADALSSVTGLSRTQIFRYIQVLKGPQDVLDAIESGLVGNLKGAAKLCGETDPVARAAMLASMASTESTGAEEDSATQEPADRPIRGAGRPRTQYKLGATSSPKAVRHIMQTIWPDQSWDIDWDDRVSVSKVFKAFLKKLEDEL